MRSFRSWEGWQRGVGASRSWLLRRQNGLSTMTLRPFCVTIPRYPEQLGEKAAHHGSTPLAISDSSSLASASARICERLKRRGMLYCVGATVRFCLARSMLLRGVHRPHQGDLENHIANPTVKTVKPRWKGPV